MKHRSKVEVWLFAAILYVVGVLAAGGNFWIGGPVLLVLLLIALPQEYVTAPEALLLLPSRKTAAPLANGVSETLRQAADEVQHVHLRGRRFHILPANALRAQPDILLNRPGKQEGILQNHAELAPQLERVHLANVRAANRSEE